MSEPPRRLAVRVTPDAGRQIRAGHPWVYDASVVSVQPDGAAGDLAVVFDEKRRFMAIGLYDPDSPIRIKVLHHGRPTPIDATFWRGRLDAALDRRHGLVGSPLTTGYRILHGENDQLPGLVLDRFDDTLVLKLYSAAWFAHLDEIVAVIEQRLEPSTLVLRLARNIGPAGEAVGLTDGLVLRGGPLPSPLLFLENGLRFEAEVVHGQKTGYFLDQRDNRARVRDLSAGCRVLDVFSCSGGFSVHAAAGGASLVHSIDISAAAIAAAKRNLLHNRDLDAVRGCTHETTVGDAARAMQRLAGDGRRFDVVVVDPPSFATRQSQVDGALHAYAHLTELALDLLVPGGTLVQASCSSRVTAEQFFDTVHAAATGSGVRLREVSRTGHGIDHPVGFPQGAYLKAIFAAVGQRPDHRRPGRV